MDKYCQEANVKWDYIKYPFGFSFIFLRKKYQDSFNLSNDANKLLDYMKNNNGILENKAKACVLIDKKERTISTLINELIKNQKIIRIGSNKTGYWKINI